MQTQATDVVVVGSGIGGLCAGALLSHAGYRVYVLERMPITGGRYTSVKYKGYTIPTASWMLLYGKDDPVYKTLQDVGAAKIEMRGAGTPMARYRIGGKVYNWPEKGALKYLLSIASNNQSEVDRVMSSLVREMHCEEPSNEISFRDWLSALSDNESIHGIFQAQIATWCGMNSHELPLGEFIRTLLSFRGKSDFRIPKNGLKDIIDALEKVIRNNNGKVWKHSPVRQIVVEDGKARSVITEQGGKKIEIGASVVISNTGPKKTVELAGNTNFDEDYLHQIYEKVRPGIGIDYLFTTNTPLLDFAGTLYTTDTQRKASWSVPTMMWPEHAPDGKHLLHGFAVPKSTLNYNPKEEHNIFMQDLEDVFPDFEQNGGQLLLRRNFCGEWPCTRAWQGYDVSQETPIENLYNVGDGVKPKGWIVGAGAAESGRIVARTIMENMEPGNWRNL